MKSFGSEFRWHTSQLAGRPHVGHRRWPADCHELRCNAIAKLERKTRKKTGSESEKKFEKKSEKKTGKKRIFHRLSSIVCGSLKWVTKRFPICINLNNPQLVALKSLKSRSPVRSSNLEWLVLKKLLKREREEQMLGESR